MLNSLEKTFSKFYKLSIKLPKTIRKSLSEYYYLIIVIWLIFQAIGLMRMLTAMGIITFFDISDTSYTVDDGLALFVGVSLTLQLIQVSLALFAINLLKAKKKKGWDLMFVSYLVAIFSLGYHWFTSTDLEGAIRTAIIVWIFGYLLYEVKSQMIKKG